MTKRSLKITIDLELDDKKGWSAGGGVLITPLDLLDEVMHPDGPGLRWEEYTSLPSHDCAHYTVAKPIHGRWDKKHGAINQHPR